MKKLDKQNNPEYRDWLKSIKTKIYSVQLKAAVSVNTELLQFYWELGADIVEKQKMTTWGSGFLKQLSNDLLIEFPDMKGFSKRNLEQIRRWYCFWIDSEAIAKQPASQLRKNLLEKIIKIPWWHNVVIVSKCRSHTEAFYYVENTIEYNWSRSVLTHQIESGLWQREGKAITNFTKSLPSPLSDGILLCKNKDKVVVEYALSDIHKPLGVSEYELTQSLPDDLKSSLPSIEEIEAEFGEGFGYGE